MTAPSRVSIPIGFSNELQQRRSRSHGLIERVSIPIGFSNELQPCSSVAIGKAEAFQSLSGFPMSCNGDRAGVSVQLVSVSIPIGFSNELQHCRSRRGRPRPGRFNPYRVFNELQHAQNPVGADTPVSIPMGFQ